LAWQIKIGVAIILGATALGTKLNSTFNDISTAINGPDSESERTHRGPHRRRTAEATK
jgi:hypothetical protein